MARGGKEEEIRRKPRSLGRGGRGGRKKNTGKEKERGEKKRAKSG